MTPDSSLPRHAQKVVVGKLLGLQVLEPQRSALGRDTAALLDSHLSLLADVALDEPDNGDELDDFLARLASDMTDLVDRLPEPSRARATRVAREFTQLVTAFCASPYDPLEQLVGAVKQTAADFYHAYDAEVPPELWRRASPIFSFCRGNVGLSFAPDVHLRIHTKFKDGDPPAAEVPLQIAPLFLNWQTIATMPRVILHEYVAHVPQGPYQGRRIHPDPTDAFAEGWMDYVAHRVHRAVLERHGPCQALTGQLFPTALYEQAAESFFTKRCDPSDGTPAAAARYEGAMAGREFHDLLRRLPKTEDDADTYLFRLSFGINCSRLNHIERQRLVTVVRRCLTSMIHAVPSWAGEALASCL